MKVIEDKISIARSEIKVRWRKDARVSLTTTARSGGGDEEGGV